MKSKHKSLGPNQTGGFGREKVVPVAEGSLQSRTPGSGPGPRGNQQSGLGGNRQADNLRSQGGQYGGVGAQQSGWSARQQAQRMQSRSEERLGQSRQSGGGMEQKQAGGSEERPAERGSLQSGASSAEAGADAARGARPGGKLDSTR
ncbi:MAG: hypothetical protein ACXWC4_13965 [Telluria sp.]